MTITGSAPTPGGGVWEPGDGKGRGGRGVGVHWAFVTPGNWVWRDASGE